MWIKEEQSLWKTEPLEGQSGDITLSFSAGNSIFKNKHNDNVSSHFLNVCSVLDTELDALKHFFGLFS